MSNATTDRAYRALCDLRERLPHIREHLYLGTPPRWTQRDLPSAVLARMGALIRAERAERSEHEARGIKSTGEGRAPLSLSVLDSERHILAGVRQLEALACLWLGLTPLAGAEATDRITRLIGLLGRIERCPEWLGHVDAEGRRLARRAARAMGDEEPIVSFRGRCPVCQCRSLRALPERELIVCAYTDCRCADPVCACQKGRRHAWQYGAAALGGEVLAS